MARCRGALSGPLPSASQPDFCSAPTCPNASGALRVQGRSDPLLGAFQSKPKVPDRQYTNTAWGFSETK